MTKIETVAEEYVCAVGAQSLTASRIEMEAVAMNSPTGAEAPSRNCACVEQDHKGRAAGCKATDIRFCISKTFF